MFLQIAICDIDVFVMQTTCRDILLTVYYSIQGIVQKMRDTDKDLNIQMKFWCKFQIDDFRYIFLD